MKLDFEHVVSDIYKVQVFNGTWLSDHEIVYVDQNGSIVIFDAETNKSSSMLVKTYDKTLHTMASFKLSPDRQSILFVSDRRTEFGSPISARYAIFNISSQTVEYLDDLIKSIRLNSQYPNIQYAAWGPQSNSILFIESNDIYYIPDFSQSIVTRRLFRLTKTGALSDSIKNGLPDSLYRGNIFSQDEQGEQVATVWWSPDGRYLAYLSFDDAKVTPIPIEYYDSYLHETSNNNNPKIHYESYPRAGGINPLVSVHIVDLSSTLSMYNNQNLPTNSDVENVMIESVTIPAPNELIKQVQLDSRLGYYVTYVGWLPKDNQLLVMWTNRAQNTSMLSICESNPTGSSSSSFFGPSSSSSSSSLNTPWKCELLSTFNQRVPLSSNAKRTILSSYNSNGTRLIFFALPRPDQVIGDHYHVAMLRGEERAPKYLTHGEFDIDRLISYDPIKDTLYFEVKVSEIAERHLYKITSIGQLANRQIKCLTCQLDEPCGYNYVHIAPGFNAKYLIHECLGPSIPITRMRLISPPAAAAAKNNTYPRSDDESLTMIDKLPTLAVLNTNQQLENLIKNKQMPIEKFIAIKTNQQVPYDVHIKLYLPNEIEDEKDKRFPLLIESSEIDKRNVWKKFDIDWGKYLASRKQLIYAKIDCVRTKPSLGGGSGGGAGSGAGASVGSSSASFSSSGQVDSSSSYRSPVSDHDEQLIDSPLFNAKDQIDVIKFLIDNFDLFPYIDRRRIAIWGPTSTSAYVALATTINDDTKLIQCTIAVSPITNWRYMSSYTAEHYLGLPWLDSNSLKYERSNLLKRSYEFSMRKLLIIHGTSDEQVHVQHSMQFIKSLNEHHMIGGVIHQMQLYPDVGHSLEQVKKHYYLTLDDFVDRCFYQKPITIKATEWKGKVRPKLYK